MAGNYNAGTAYIDVDGKNYVLKGQAAYQCSGESREPIKGQNGYHGTKNMPQPGQITGKFQDGDDVSIDALNSITNATVTLELANGKTVVGRNMRRTGDPIKVDAEEGEFDIEFTGPAVREI